jgi:hypothetical protein
VAIDAEGNVYYAWIAADRLPYLSISRNGGDDWSRPISVKAPGVKESNLISLAAGAEGRIAIAYLGSRNSLFQDCRSDDDCDRPYTNVTWDGYVTATDSILTRNPVFYSAPVNPKDDPLVYGACGPGRCYPVWDFIDVQIDSQGRPWAALIDGERGETSGEGVVGLLTRAPSLR